VRGYTDLLRRPSVAWLLLSSLVGRYPQGMSTLAITLATVGAGGSYARAGLVSAAYVVGAAVALPRLGRLLDRYDRRPILVCTGVLSVALFVVFAIAIDAALWQVSLLAVATGAVTPPLSSALRSTWPALVPTRSLPAALSLEASAQEIIFVTGPMLVALIAATAGPREALVCAGATTLVGALAFAASPRSNSRLSEQDGPAPVRPGLLAKATFRRTLLAALVADAGMTTASLAVIAIVAGPGAHASTETGIALGIWSLGSLAGGLAIGAIRGALDRPVWMFFAASAVHLVALAAADSLWAVYLVLLVGGTTTAPIFARLYARVLEDVPQRSAGEAFGWLTTAFFTGSALGGALGGASITAVGAHPTALLAAALLCVAALVTVVGAARSPRS
jgi:predicted MFS family arabinose efflux permease